jgi:hypothetical protein
MKDLTALEAKINKTFNETRANDVAMEERLIKLI